MRRSISWAERGKGGALCLVQRNFVAGLDFLVIPPLFRGRGRGGPRLAVLHHELYEQPPPPPPLPPLPPPPGARPVGEFPSVALLGSLRTKDPPIYRHSLSFGVDGLNLGRL